MSFNITKNFTVNNARQVPYVPRTITDPYFSSVSLLLRAETTNTIIDSSTNNYTASGSGTAVQVAGGPIVSIPGVLSTGTSNGAGAGTGTATLLSGNVFNFGTGNFTIEFWAYFNNVNNNHFVVDARSGEGAYPVIFAGSDALLRWWVNTGASPTITGPSMAVAWYHIAIVRNGSTTTMYRNGISVGSSADTTNYLSAATVGICASMNGYMTNLRVVKGTAVYTSNFTVPNAPLTAITNTALLLKFDNTRFVDSSGAANNLSIVGTPKISNTVFKYGTGSLSFNGTTDGLSTPVTSSFDWASGASNLTVECWINPISLGSPNMPIWGTSAAFSDSKTVLYIYPTGKIEIGRVGLNGTGSASGIITIGSWQHVATVLVASTNTTTVYVNGVSAFSTTMPVWSSGNASFLVGKWFNSSAWFNGYIDDLRITKGVARYTASFTPPVQAPTS